MLARDNFDGLHDWDKRSTLLQDAQQGGLLTRPTPAVTSPARPESAKTASSPKDAPIHGQGRKGVLLLQRFTFYASRFTHLQNEAGGLFQHPDSRLSRHGC